MVTSFLGLERSCRSGFHLRVLVLQWVLPLHFVTLRVTTRPQEDHSVSAPGVRSPLTDLGDDAGESALVPDWARRQVESLARVATELREMVKDDGCVQFHIYGPPSREVQTPFSEIAPQ